MSTPQTDHYQSSLLALDFVAEARRDLAAEYANGHNRARIADLHHSIGVDLKLADIHATLALRDAHLDLRANLVALADERGGFVPPVMAAQDWPAAPLTGDSRG